MRHLYSLILILVMLLAASWLFGLEDQDKIDSILAKKDAAALNSYLQSKKASAEYAQIEEYLLNKVEEYIFAGEYDWARAVVNVVLSNNLDNAEAQRLYLYLKDLKEEEQAIQAEVTPESFVYDFSLGPADLMLYFSQYYNDYYGETKLNLKYGFSADFGFYFNHPSFSAGVDLVFDAYLVDIANTSGSVFFYSITPAIKPGFFGLPVFFTLGFAQVIYSFDADTNQVVDVFITNFFSPTIGLKLKRLFFNDFIGIDAAVNYYIGCWFTSYIDAMFDASFTFIYRFYRLNRYNFFVKAELKDLFLLSDSKVENAVKLQFCLGMGINEK